jgi:hypothetical protein
MASGEALIAKNFVRGVMIIQKNADARTHPRPPPGRARFKRADREQEIHSLLLIRLDIAFACRNGGKAGTAGRVCRESGDRETVAAWRVPGKRFCGPGVY